MREFNSLGRHAYPTQTKDDDMSYDHDAVIAMLTKCSDDNGTHWYQGRALGDPETCPTCDGTNDAGWLRCPGSQYGLTSRDVAEQVWVIGKALGWKWSPDSLMVAMVNNEDWPGEEYRDYIQRTSGISIDDAVSGYLEYQLWAQRDHDQDDRDGGSSLADSYSVSDIDSRYVEQVKRELSEFNATHPLAVRMYLAHHTSEDFGGDFYLTREGHGTGVWDRGLGELGDYLTEQIKTYGHADDLWDDGTGVLVG